MYAAALACITQKIPCPRRAMAPTGLAEGCVTHDACDVAVAPRLEVSGCAPLERPGGRATAAPRKRVAAWKVVNAQPWAIGAGLLQRSEPSDRPSSRSDWRLLCSAGPPSHALTSHTDSPVGVRRMRRLRHGTRCSRAGR